MAAQYRQPGSTTIISSKRIYVCVLEGGGEYTLIKHSVITSLSLKSEIIISEKQPINQGLECVRSAKRRMLGPHMPYYARM
jgi:hypothetical protein